jgi:hypothetical protein
MEWEQLRKRLGAKSSDFERLQKSALFTDVPSEAMAALLISAVVRSYRRNTVLFLQDEPADHFYVVSYQIRLISSASGFWATSGSWCGL